jgi:hypothetical protein
VLPFLGGAQAGDAGGGCWKAGFAFEETSPTLLTLHGEMDGKKIQAKLRKAGVEIHAAL